MSNGLKTFNNMFWRFMEKCGAKGASFIISIILARILEPSVYGTVSLVLVFTTVLQVFVDSGLGNALVQKKDADELDFSTVFFFNMLICVGLYLFLFFAAPIISHFYDMPQLISVIRIIGITLIISGLQNIQQSYITKYLMFKKSFFATISATIVSAIVGIIMAYRGYGVWALVAQNISYSLSSTIVLWIMVKWRPKKTFSFQRLKGLFSYGWKILVSVLIDTIYNDVNQLIIGKTYDPKRLAFYNRANQFPYTLSFNVYTSMNSVLFPTMAQSQNDVERVKHMTRRAIKTSTYFMFPLMLGLAACSKLVVKVLLTDKWLECVPMMIIFCFVYALYPINAVNSSTMKALGRSDYFLKLEIIKKVIGISAILITMWISVEALAIGMLITTILSTVFNIYPNKKLIGYSIFEQLKDISGNLILSLVMMFCVWLVSFVPIPNLVLKLAIMVISGAIVYITFSVIFKVESFKYLLNILKEFKCIKR